MLDDVAVGTAGWEVLETQSAAMEAAGNSSGCRIVGRTVAAAAAAAAVAVLGKQTGCTERIIAAAAWAAV